METFRPGFNVLDEIPKLVGIVLIRLIRNPVEMLVGEMGSLHVEIGIIG